MLAYPCHPVNKVPLESILVLTRPPASSLTPSTRAAVATLLQQQASVPAGQRGRQPWPGEAQPGLSRATPRTRRPIHVSSGCPLRPGWPPPVQLTTSAAGANGRWPASIGLQREAEGGRRCGAHQWEECTRRTDPRRTRDLKLDRHHSGIGPSIGLTTPPSSTWSRPPAIKSALALIEGSVRGQRDRIIRRESQRDCIIAPYLFPPSVSAGKR
jgi:hypothetical protein